MTTIYKLKAAIADIKEAKFIGIYKGRYHFKGVAITLPSVQDLIALGANLAKAEADSLVHHSAHFDEMGESLLVAWDIELFEDCVELLDEENEEDSAA